MIAFRFRSMFVVVQVDVPVSYSEAGTPSLARTRADKSAESYYAKAIVAFQSNPNGGSSSNNVTASSMNGNNNPFSTRTKSHNRSQNRAAMQRVLEDASEVLDYLRANKCNNVKEISTLPKQEVTDDDIQQLTDFIRINYQHIDIEKLSLVDCALTTNASKEIAKLVQIALPTLTEFDISENPQLKARGVQELIEVLTSTEASHNGSNLYRCSLYRLNLSNIGLIGSAAAPLISSLIRNNSTIRDLNLAQNSLGNKGIKSIAASLCFNTTLKVLDLKQNKMKDAAVRELMDGLIGDKNDSKSSTSFSCALVELNLSGNNITPIGASHVANALRHSRLKNLSVLDISLNQIGVEGASHIATALEQSRTIKSLNLSQNQIGNGVISIAQAIQKNHNNTCLSTLDVSLNSITDDGCIQIASMLRNNTSMEILNLASNAISDIGITHLANALFDNATMVELDISGNQMRDPKPFINLICHYDPSYSDEKIQSLQLLKYENNNLSPSDEDKLAFVIRNFNNNKRTWLKTHIQQIQNATLRMMNLWSYEHSDEEIIALTNLMRKHHIQMNIPSNLTQVFLGCPRVTDHGVHSFAAYIFECNHIKQVVPTTTGNNVGANSINSTSTSTRKTTIGSSVQGIYLKDCVSITLQGMTYISHALMRNRTLRCLSVSNCNVDGKGAKLLYNALKANTTLQRLTLENNQIGDTGAVYILRLIQKPETKQQSSTRSPGSVNRMTNLAVTATPLLTSLNSLNLSKNGISDLAMQYLKPRTLIPTVKELYLHSNKLTDVGASHLANAFSDHSTASQVNVSSNYLSMEGIECLKGSFPSTTFVVCDRQNTPQQGT